MTDKQTEVTILDAAKEIQEECHKTVEYIVAHTENCNHQDATNVFIFRKLAELQLQINQNKQ